MDVAVLAALIWKVIDFIKQVLNFSTNRSAVITQALTWATGVGFTVLASHAGATEHLVLPGVDAQLGALDWPSQVIVGLLVASVGSAFYDVKRAIDGRDSAVQPPLLG